MVSDDADWSSGATGMACDADIAAKPRPMANAEIAKIFIANSFSFIWLDDETDGFLNYSKIWQSNRRWLTSDGGASDGGATDAIPNDGGASPSDADASAGASDDPSALLPA
jgi:hypothetical protein